MTFQKFYRDTVRQVERDISEIKEPGCLDPDSLFSKYSLKIIDLKMEEAHLTSRPRVIRGGARDGHGQERLVVDIRVPFAPNPEVQKILSLTPTQTIIGLVSHHFRLSVPDAHFTLTEIEIADSKNPQKTIDQVLENFSRNIHRYNIDIKSENREFKTRIEKACEKRRESLRQTKIAEETALTNISLPIITHSHKKPVSVQTKKKIAQVRKQSKERAPLHPMLEQKHVDDFIDTLFRLGKQFELAPKAYAKLDEENLRHILLSVLNAVFEMNGKGEAFNRLGKTDLYFSLAVDEGQVFIGECKIWKGRKGFIGALEQLFGYLDWRRNFAALIVFTKKTAMSTVLSGASSELKTHHTFKSLDASRENEGFLVSSHSHPRDAQKPIVLFSLFFDLSC
jgi:hypothetical protein